MYELDIEDRWGCESASLDLVHQIKCSLLPYCCNILLLVVLLTIRASSDPGEPGEANAKLSTKSRKHKQKSIHVMTTRSLQPDLLAHWPVHVNMKLPRVHCTCCINPHLFLSRKLVADGKRFTRCPRANLRHGGFPISIAPPP